MQTKSNTSKTWRIIVSLTLVFAMFFALSIPVLAADGSSGIETTVKQSTKSIYNILKGIVGSIATIIIAGCGIKILMGTEQDVEKAKNRMVVCAVAIFVVFVGPLMVEQVTYWFSASTSPFSASSTSTGPDGVIINLTRTTGNSIYALLVAIVTPICGVMMSFAGIQMLMGSDKEMDMLRKRLLISMAVVAIVYLAPSLVNQVADWSVRDDSLFNMSWTSLP